MTPAINTAFLLLIYFPKGNIYLTDVTKAPITIASSQTGLIF